MSIILEGEITITITCAVCGQYCIHALHLTDHKANIVTMDGLKEKIEELIKKDKWHINPHTVVYCDACYTRDKKNMM